MHNRRTFLSACAGALASSSLAEACPRRRRRRNGVRCSHTRGFANFKEIEDPYGPPVATYHRYYWRGARVNLEDYMPQGYRPEPNLRVLGYPRTGYDISFFITDTNQFVSQNSFSRTHRIVHDFIIPAGISTFSWKLRAEGNTDHAPIRYTRLQFFIVNYSNRVQHFRSDRFGCSNHWEWDYQWPSQVYVQPGNVMRLIAEFSFFGCQEEDDDHHVTQGLLSLQPILT